MGVVRFAELCDHCGRRSREYTWWGTCAQCGDSVCSECSDTEIDDETGDCVCRRCAELADKDFTPPPDAVRPQGEGAAERRAR